MRYLSLKASGSRGMSLVESLIACTIMAGSLLSLAYMQASFGKQYLDRRLQSALQDVAASEMARCRIGAAANASVTYLGFAVTVSRTGGDCLPAQSACQNIAVTTMSNNRTYSLVSKVCGY